MTAGSLTTIEFLFFSSGEINTNAKRIQNVKFVFGGALQHFTGFIQQHAAIMKSLNNFYLDFQISTIIDNIFLRYLIKKTLNQRIIYLKLMNLKKDLHIQVRI